MAARLRLKKRGKSSSRGDRWSALPWKTIDLSNEDLGEYNDAVFFGLEEIDGTDYQKYVSGAPEEDEEIKENHIEPPSLPKKKKVKKKLDQKAAVEKKAPLIIPIDDSPLSWADSISLHNQLVSSLTTLNFSSPTPIQSISIPIILSGNCDVVGSAETGSGKTLAFGLPVLHSLLNDWELLAQRSRHSPYALILAPTRELAVQISTVLNDVCKLMTARKVQVVNIIGGMSEHKQRRLLSSPYKPVHIIVSTPGRLCDLISDPELVVLQDLSRLRYLVVDEADRMVEDGHFPELFKIFNQIRRHEKLASEGKDPLHEAHLTRLGTNFDDLAEEGGPSGTSHLQEAQGFVDQENQEIGFEDNFDLHFDEMPSEADLVAARNAEAPEGPEEISKETAEPYVANARQTLLYSATAMGLKKEEGDSKRRRKQLKKEHSLAGPKRVAYLQSLGIPEHLRQLLETVGIQNTTEIAIATQLKENSAPGPVDVAPVNLTKKRKSPEAEVEAPPTLPSGLKQLEIRVPAEEKDLIAYFFLLKVPSSSLDRVSLSTESRPDHHLCEQHQDCAETGWLAQGSRNQQPRHPCAAPTEAEIKSLGVVSIHPDRRPCCHRCGRERAGLASHPVCLALRHREVSTGEPLILLRSSHSPPRSCTSIDLAELLVLAPPELLSPLWPLKMECTTRKSVAL
jgi:hypothetical protein